MGLISMGNGTHFSLHISHSSICLTLECCLFQLLRVRPRPLQLRGGGRLHHRMSLHVRRSSLTSGPPALLGAAVHLRLLLLLLSTPDLLLRRRRRRSRRSRRSRVSRFIFYYAICGSCNTRIYFSFPIPGLMANNGKLHHFSFNISH